MTTTTRNVGIWIDHREAVIVSLDHNSHEEQIETCESDADRPTRQMGGAPSRGSTPWGPQDVASDTRRDRRYKHQLDQYYEEVIGKLGGADAILIFGPGAAKTELKKHLDDTHILRDRVVGVETTDKMTRPQIAAKVREFYTGKK